MTLTRKNRTLKKVIIDENIYFIRGHEITV